MRVLGGKVIGSVTAGAWSPFLETGIAIVQLNCDLENVSEAKLKNSEGIHEIIQSRAEFPQLEMIDLKKFHF